MQIFIGSKNNEQDWLPQSDENIRLLRCAPVFLFRDITGRYDYYEFKPRHEKHFLRILKNGFFISKFPSAKWSKTKTTIYIHELVKYIAQLFLFACRVMKKKGIKDSQRIRIEILNVRGILVGFNDNFFGQSDYDFAENVIVLEDDFNPESDWKSLINLLGRIYRAICEHAGITGIADEAIKADLRAILGWIHELRTDYKDSGVTALDLNELFKDL